MCQDRLLIIVGAVMFSQHDLHKLIGLCGLVVRVPGYRSRGPGSIRTLPDFLKSNGSGTGCTQPREDN
jgi:arylsulfatase A-like enzyme